MGKRIDISCRICAYNCDASPNFSESDSEEYILAVVGTMNCIMTGHEAEWSLKSDEAQEDSSYRLTQIQNHLGFVDGETYCKKCHLLLTRDDCHWAFGSWWHKNVESCLKPK